MRIKNWNSCIPDEVRKNPDFMPIYPFERVVFPRRVASPFLADPGLNTPGGIADANTNTSTGAGAGAGGVGDRADENGATAAAASGLRKRPKRAAAAKSDAERLAVLKGLAPLTSSSHHSQQQQQQQQQQQTQHAPPPAPAKDDRSIIAAAGGLAALGHSASMEELPFETGVHDRRRGFTDVFH